MRKVLAVVGILLLSAVAAEASTLHARLVTSDAGGGLWNVAVQIQTQGTTDGSQGDGGISGRSSILSVSATTCRMPSQLRRLDQTSGKWLIRGILLLPAEALAFLPRKNSTLCRRRILETPFTFPMVILTVSALRSRIRLLPDCIIKLGTI